MKAPDAGTARRHSMSTRFGLIAGLLGVAVLLTTGCSDAGGASTSTTAPATTTTTAIGDDFDPLFTAADAVLDPNPLAVRHRAVEVNLDVLLRSNGRARNVDRVAVNLFPDTTYTGVIVEREEMGNGHTWVGYLEGIEVSSLTMVWTGSAFAANFASPAGVYEVALAADGIYEIAEMDQEAFPGEG